MDNHLEFSVDTLKLRKKMLEEGIETIEELSKVTKVNRNTLSSVLKGKSLPSTPVMYAITKALHLRNTEAGIIFFKSKLS